MNPNAYLAMGIVIVYLVAVNLFIQKRSKIETETSFEDFAVGGRQFKWYMIMFTILATWYTGSCFTGAFGYAVSFGVFALYDTTQVIVSLVLLYVIGPKVWRWGKIHKLYNLPDFIELRYRDKKLSFVLALYTIFIGFPWTVMGFKTFGYVIHALTYGALPFWLGIAIAAAFILTYTLRGGTKSVVTSDFIQGLIMIFGSLVVVLLMTYKNFGGFAPMFREVATRMPELLTVQDSAGWSSVIIAGILGSFCWMEIFNRMFVARSEEELTVSTVGAPVLGASMYILLLLLGIGAALIPEVAANPENGFLKLAEMSGGPVLLGIAGILIFAAEISSTDSGIVTGGVVIANTIIKRIKPSMPNDKLVRTSRIAIFFEVVIAATLATRDLPMLMEIGMFTFVHIIHVFPTAILGVVWRRGNRRSAWAGIAVGMTVTVFFELCPSYAGVLKGWDPGVVGFVCNLIVYVVVALLSAPEKETEALFEEVSEQEKELYRAQEV